MCVLYSLVFLGVSCKVLWYIVFMNVNGLVCWWIVVFGGFVVLDVYVVYVSVLLFIGL